MERSRPSPLPPSEILPSFIEFHTHAASNLQATADIFTDPTGEFDEQGLITAMRITRNAFSSIEPVTMDTLYDQFAEANLIWKDENLGINRLTTLYTCYTDSKAMWNSYLDSLDRAQEEPGLPLLS